MFDWISNCADGVIFSGCIFNCLLDFTNLFNTVIVTTKISRDTAPSPAPMAIYNVRPLSVKDKKKQVISMGHKISIRACSQSMRVSGNAHLNQGNNNKMLKVPDVGSSTAELDVHIVAAYDRKIDLA